MVLTAFLRQITKPVAGLCVMALVAVAGPPRSEARLSASEERTPQMPPANLAQASQTQTGYKLRPGDLIRVDNLESRELSGEHLIPEDGSISLPMIGGVYVRGLTLEQAAEAIEAQYLRFFKYPSVGVSLISPGPIDITVAGEVNLPGSYAISVQDFREGRAMKFPTVTDAIAQAGGVTLASNLRGVQVRRRQPNGTQQVINVDLWEFLLSGGDRQNINLQAGDTVFVPTTNQIDLAQVRQIATAPISSDLTTPRTVAVLGEVATPGPYVVKGGDTQVERISEGLPTVTRALQLAGGMKPTADLRQIQIRRLTKSGQELIFYVNLWEFLRQGDVNQDTVLQEGDTVIVPTGTNMDMAEARQVANASFAIKMTEPRTVTVVGQVLRPGPYVVQGGDTQSERFSAGMPTVTRALQLAGGISPDADIRRIQVRRPTRAGADQIFNVDLWQMMQTGDVSQDLIVLEGDTILVPTATELNPAETAQIRSASFAPDTITVYVVGEGRGSGLGSPNPQVQLPPNTPLNQALLASGAFNNTDASRSKVELIRLEQNGTVEQRTVDVDWTAGINEQTNPILRNQDMIVVKRTGRAKITDTLEDVANAMLIFPRVETMLRILNFMGVIDNNSFD